MIAVRPIYWFSMTLAVGVIKLKIRQNILTKICEILYIILWLLYVLNHDRNNPGTPTHEINNFNKIYA